MVKQLTFDSYMNLFDNNNNYIEEKPCVIDFYANWCQPCKMVSPILEELSNKYKEDINFFKVDIEEEDDLVSMYSIRSIPTFVFIFSNGEVEIIIGAPTKEKLEEKLKELI